MRITVDIPDLLLERFRLAVSQRRDTQTALVRGWVESYVAEVEGKRDEDWSRRPVTAVPKKRG